MIEVESNQSKTFQDFIEKYPEYHQTAVLDELRFNEYARLDSQSHVYLDYTGGNLYSQKQVDKHLNLLRYNVFGNPHSTNPTSQLSTKLVEEAREYVLKYFNAGDDYYCVFTLNATAALKIVGECYPFSPESQFLLTYDNHNSVNGIREYARHKGSGFSYVPLYIEDLAIDDSVLKQKLAAYPDAKNKLFAFPAQSNVSGTKHSLEWINEAQKQNWDVLLDAAAFVPTNKLDLERVKPNFVSISFYKIFGYPTGIGCLLVRVDSFKKLLKPWFAGGTVSLVSVGAESHYLINNHERFEEGTINYLSIPAIKIGLQHIESVGINTINKRVSILTDYLLSELPKIKHDSGHSVVNIYGNRKNENRGGTIIINFIDRNKRVYPFDVIETMANAKKISLRTGCFCNPGIDEVNNCINTSELKEFFTSRNEGNYKDMMEYLGKMRGAVRVSMGIVSNFEDIKFFLDFVKSFRNAEY